MCVCVGMCILVHVCIEARDVASPGVGVIGSCRLPYMSAGNWTWVLWMSSKWS